MIYFHISFIFFNGPSYVFKKLKGEHKELMIIPDAVHTDLYDQTDIIPFNKITAFFDEYLKSDSIEF